MNQRLSDKIDVLNEVVNEFHSNPRAEITDLRKSAVNEVAKKRNVNFRTVFAHLVEKNTVHTVSADQIDKMIHNWVISNSNVLEEWILITCDDDSERRAIVSFFSKFRATPHAIDIEEFELPARHRLETYRILRDTVIARQVKSEYGYRCQLCGTTIELSNGELYAEAHHVKPLGDPHHGNDKIDNIVCVCPNCHVLLDYGAVEMRQDSFPNISLEFIQYHNGNIYKG